MNYWIKLQKIIIFIPVANLFVFTYNEIYYKRICKNSSLAFKVCASSVLGILFIGMPIAFLLSDIFEQYPFWEELRGIIYPYWLPLTMNYAMLRTQCKRLNVKPDEIGPGFYKFLLLKKKDKTTPAPLSEDHSESSSEDAEDHL